MSDKNWAARHAQMAHNSTISGQDVAQQMAAVDYQLEKGKEQVMTDRELSEKLQTVADADVARLVKAQASYGDSWKRRGGVGAFMMLARKWDRLELQAAKHGYDIQHCIANDARPEGIIDDIRDLRRYLLLVEQEWGATTAEVAK